MLPGGYFISFEGGEGAGKSTQVNYIAGHLRRKGFKVVVTREPGGTSGAESIRYVLLNSNMQHYKPAMEIILFAAARIDHMDKLITPALKAGKIVLCDRFIDSTRVYQGMIGNVPQDYVLLLEKIAVHDMMPDLTFILDLPAKEGMRRARARKEPACTDHFEKANVSVQEARRQAFLRIARMECKRCHVINAIRPTRMVTAEIIKICDKKIYEQEMCTFNDSTAGI